MSTQLEILIAKGVKNADSLIKAAELEYVPLYIATAVLMKETGGANIYGHDKGGAMWGAGEVTEENFKEFLRLIGSGQTSNGVGPMQITWKGFFPDADLRGLKLWIPLDNMRYGLSLISGYLGGSESDEAIIRAGTRYNGAAAYGASLLTIARQWQQILTPDDTTGAVVPNDKTGDLTMVACKTEYWRGKRFCSHSIPKLERLAAAVGQGVLLTPIQGSFSFDPRSANTHGGGGAGDFECDGLTWEQGRMMETKSRQNADGLGYLRWWVGNKHLHWLDPDCPNLSQAAAAQFLLFKQGYDALVGNNRDTGDRTWSDEIIRRFSTRMVSDAITAIVNATGTYQVKSGDTLGKIATAYKVTVAQLVSWNGIKDANAINVGQILKVKAPTVAAKPPVVAKPPAPKVNYDYPYQNSAGWFPYPGRVGSSYYGPSRPKTAWYSGIVAGGKNTGLNTSGNLSLQRIRENIIRIQRLVGAFKDGKYGPATVKAVQAWQKKNGLPADGIVGPSTWKKMAASRGQGK